jgi:hypothetical protein
MVKIRTNIAVMRKAAEYGRGKKHKNEQKKKKQQE